jgi:hypothetical protein
VDQVVVRIHPTPDLADPGRHSSLDREMADVIEQGRVANVQTLAKPPRYKGSSTAKRRDRVYSAVCTASEVLYRVEAQTLRRICYCKLEVSFESVTEEVAG